MEQGPVPPEPRLSAEGASNHVEPDTLAGRLASTPAYERAAVIVEYFAPQASSKSLDWINELTARVEQFGLSVPEIRRTTADLAWMARLAEQPYPGDAERIAARGLHGSRMKRLVLAYVNGYRLRFDYRFAQLQRHTNEWLAEFSDDALVLAFAAFAALGTRAPHGIDLFHRAVKAPDSDNKSRHTCLMAIWFADHVEEQPQILLELSSNMIARGEDNDVVHYRRAAALRKLGRYDEALTEVDRAIDLLGAGNIMVHEQFAQERRTIITTQDLRNHAEEVTGELGVEISAQVEARIAEASTQLEEKISEASAQLAQRVNIAQELVSSGLLKMVEVLGLFVTLLGFLIGSGTVIIKADTFSERAIAMAVVLVGALAFFGLLRLVTSVRRRQPF